jgi:hypothetical protein
MAQRLSTPYVSSVIPNAYVNYSVNSIPVGVASSGVMVIFGEANGGPSYSQTTLANSFYTPDQLSKIVQTFTSGQIVDAFTEITAPSNDAAITGTATGVYVVKTNSGTKATATLAPSYGTLSDINYGTLGNADQYQVLAVNSEDGPTITGVTVPSYGATTGAMFSVRSSGGAEVVVGPLAASANQAALVTNLNAALSTASVNLSATPGTATDTITLTFSATPGSSVPVADASAWAEGSGKSFELIDSTPGDLASIGMTAGLNVSSQEPEIEVQDSNATRAINETLGVNASIGLAVGYEGATATMTINPTTGLLTTTVTGGSGGNLSIVLSQYTTIGTLAGFIASQAGYSASAIPSANQLPTSALDAVSAIGIASTSAGDEPGRIKTSAYNFKQAMAISRLFTFAATATAGLPTPMAASAFLSGGTRGATLAADIVNVINSLGAVNCNIIVPLISQSATADILAGQTDPASTYTIAALNALMKSHCLEYSNPSLGKNRICVLSYNTTFANASAAAQGLASFRCSLTFQQVTQVNSLGVVTTFQPWMASVCAGAMQCGGFYQAITNKYANLISIVDPSDYNSGEPGDTSEAIEAGLMTLFTDVGGVRWVVDQTTYSFDNSFVYNSMQAVYDADLIAIDLKTSFSNAFVGKSLADVSAASVSAFLTQKMAGYMQLKLIAPSNGVPLGFNGAKVVIAAPTVTVTFNLYLATEILFIPITFGINPVQQSA